MELIRGGDIHTGGDEQEAAEVVKEGQVRKLVKNVLGNALDETEGDISIEGVCGEDVENGEANAASKQLAKRVLKESMEENAGEIFIDESSSDDERNINEKSMEQLNCSEKRIELDVKEVLDGVINIIISQENLQIVNQKPDKLALGKHVTNDETDPVQRLVKFVLRGSVEEIADDVCIINDSDENSADFMQEIAVKQTCSKKTFDLNVIKTLNGLINTIINRENMLSETQKPDNLALGIYFHDDEAGIVRQLVKGVKKATPEDNMENLFAEECPDAKIKINNKAGGASPVLTNENIMEQKRRVKILDSDVRKGKYVDNEACIASQLAKRVLMQSLEESAAEDVFAEEISDDERKIVTVASGNSIALVKEKFMEKKFSGNIIDLEVKSVVDGMIETIIKRENLEIVNQKPDKVTLGKYVDNEACIASQLAKRVLMQSLEESAAEDVFAEETSDDERKIVTVANGNSIALVKEKFMEKKFSGNIIDLEVKSVVDGMIETITKRENLEIVNQKPDKVTSGRSEDDSQRKAIELVQNVPDSNVLQVEAETSHQNVPGASISNGHIEEDVAGVLQVIVDKVSADFIKHSLSLIATSAGKAANGIGSTSEMIDVQHHGEKNLLQGISVKAAMEISAEKISDDDDESSIRNKFAGKSSTDEAVLKQSRNDETVKAEAAKFLNGIINDVINLDKKQKSNQQVANLNLASNASTSCQEASHLGKLVVKNSMSKLGKSNPKQNLAGNAANGIGSISEMIDVQQHGEKNLLQGTSVKAAMEISVEKISDHDDESSSRNKAAGKSSTDEAVLKQSRNDETVKAEAAKFLNGIINDVNNLDKKQKSNQQVANLNLASNASTFCQEIPHLGQVVLKNSLIKLGRATPKQNPVERKSDDLQNTDVQPKKSLRKIFLKDLSQVENPSNKDATGKSIEERLQNKRGENLQQCLQETPSEHSRPAQASNKGYLCTRTMTMFSEFDKDSDEEFSSHPRVDKSLESLVVQDAVLLEEDCLPPRMNRPQTKYPGGKPRRSIWKKLKDLFCCRCSSKTEE